ncbi:oligosaccharide biosynthesis protein Alg14 [Halomonas sp. SpR8]|uniref:oligosaccharide biosynthesis protein Alg14 n=1 Tax=Halomonas sp. SpR8 TaxID=3050463 RepID=UPI0027E52AEE|nr:oligosaccharide biosynthesis protein Alg14 [Halomonas sp. SpR8]MDQ7727263.1 oligosaccharide biosynthesis protein Alg14 [Halomonas sp. SpR8]
MVILMVASFGGHFIQLKRLYHQVERQAPEGQVMFKFITTEDDVVVDNEQALCFTNVHRGSGWKAIIASLKQAFGKLKTINPDVVISTGALPGLMVCFMAKLMRKKVIWVDSMANYQQLSFSGRLAKFFCDVCLTQWEHLAENDKRVTYWGKVL